MTAVLGINANTGVIPRNSAERSGRERNNELNKRHQTATGRVCSHVCSFQWIHIQESSLFPLLTLQWTWFTHRRRKRKSGRSDMPCRVNKTGTEWHTSHKTPSFHPPCGITSPSLSEDGIISVETHKSRSASVIPKGSSWATWCPHICSSSGCRERYRRTRATARRRGGRKRGDRNPKEGEQPEMMRQKMRAERGRGQEQNLHRLAKVAQHTCYTAQALLTGLMEPRCNQGIVKIYTTDAQWIKFGHVVTSHLQTRQHSYLNNRVFL